MIINAPTFLLYGMGGLVCVRYVRVRSHSNIVLLVLWCLLWGIYATPLPFWILRGLENDASSMAAAKELPDQWDGFVLLGGCCTAEGLDCHNERIHYNLAGSRLFEFVVLARKWPDKTIVLTGTRAEARGMLCVLQRFGIDTKRIILEENSRCTYDNAVNTFKLVQPKGTWVLVTSAFHMKRAAQLFERAGWRIVLCPVGYLASNVSSWLAHPMNGWAWYAGIKEHLGLLSARI